MYLSDGDGVMIIKHMRRGAHTCVFKMCHKRQEVCLEFEDTRYN